ncbi:DeoR family transcriptional regulator [Streptomyces sp. R33]|uniref:DeoR family transcriptional regulator n=1 Tax=Streptomyces sp. R33 TaxID=3238629 RepID=A0AB39Y8C1_9ACTN
MSAARLQAIRELFVQQPGPLRTGQVWQYCKANGLAPCRATVRRDLEQLTAQGLLRPEGPENDRVYWLRRFGGGR